MFAAGTKKLAAIEGPGLLWNVTPNCTSIARNQVRAQELHLGLELLPDAAIGVRSARSRGMASRTAQLSVICLPVVNPPCTTIPFGGARVHGDVDAVPLLRLVPDPGLLASVT